MSLVSDTAAPAHPAVLEALSRANAGFAPSYGGDALSGKAAGKLSELFETEVAVWLAGSGTAANALAVAILCSPLGSVLCHDEAHIARDERGAPEFFTGGGKLQPLPGAHGRIEEDALADALARRNPAFVHETPAEVLSLTNLTECGTVYGADETRRLCARAREAGLWTHLDGARFANAAAATGESPAALTWKAGVDVLTFGATKNGALGCDAVVLFGRARPLAPQLQARAKRAGQMPPKMRFLAAQLLALLEDGLWLENARTANARAAALGAGLAARGRGLAHPVEGNEVFVHLDADAQARLRQAGIGFHPWPDGSCRFVCSWATQEADVEAVLGALR